jgi:hypothetical protein
VSEEERPADGTEGAPGPGPEVAIPAVPVPVASGEPQDRGPGEEAHRARPVVRRRLGPVLILALVCVLALAGDAALLVSQQNAAQARFQAAAMTLGQVEAHLERARSDLTLAAPNLAAANGEVQYAQGLVDGIQYSLQQSGVFTSDLDVRLLNDQTALSVLMADGHPTPQAIRQVAGDLASLVGWAQQVNWNQVTPSALQHALSRVAP